MLSKTQQYKFIVVFKKLKFSSAQQNIPFYVKMLSACMVPLTPYEIKFFINSHR